MSAAAPATYGERRIAKHKGELAREAAEAARRVEAWRAAHPAEAEWLDANADKFWVSSVREELRAMGTLCARNLWRVRRNLIPRPLRALAVAQ